MLVGLIADTHDEVVAFDTVRDAVRAAFDGVELILHCGDLTTTGVLDTLGEIAPVLAVRSSGDPAAEPPRLLEGPHVLSAGGLTIGLVNTRGEAGVAELFGQPVDVVVHGGTHRASVETTPEGLSVNPGSPTLADQVSVGVLEITEGRATARIVPLS